MKTVSKNTSHRDNAAGFRKQGTHSPLPRILILGIGNLLLQDEGVGIHTLNRLKAKYEFSPNVTLLDGGTLGIKLMDAILQSDRLIVIDAVQQGGKPGALYSLTAGDVGAILNLKNSLHQLNFLETLAYLRLTDKLPDTSIIGIEPENCTDWGVEMTGTISGRMDKIEDRVLTEVSAAGGMFKYIKKI